MKTDYGRVTPFFASQGFVYNDDVVISTDRRDYVFSQMPFYGANGEFVCETADARFAVAFRKVEDTQFFTRSITVSFAEKTVLRRIAVKVPCAEEGFLYDTFFNASAAAFFRSGELGCCMGFENPFCRLENGELYFEPSWMLKEQEEYSCDLNFFGEYKLSGKRIRPELCRTQMYVNGRYQPRYRNPGEGIALDLSEIDEFVKYTRQYFACSRKAFKFMTYDFFGNLPQRPRTEAEVEAYLRHIDACAAIGCDTILLNPLHPNRIPDGAEDSFWELFPESTTAEKILSYARSKGLKIGMYTGTAGNGTYGNSSMIGYADVPQWKKVDIRGNVSEENCLADDAFRDWFIRVQKNTIEKYDLDVWAWDPGPGNGFFCHSDRHGHLPGRGDYKGFRNSLYVMKALKDAFPDLYYQGFHGNKEYGLWGFKYIDQHEAYWENEVYVMNPVFDELSVDRATADNIRQQSMWNYCFRFMPTELNHGIAHRMIQANWMQMLDLDLVFDYIGWKYALLSAIAYGGSVTLTIVPREPEKIDGYIEFYRQWIAFARETFHLPTVPFGSQVGCGIDAVAKMAESRGYVFLFNPFPKDHHFRFEPNKRIGISGGRKWCINMIYPYRKALGTYKASESIDLVVPAYECVVLELSAEEKPVQEDVCTPALPRVLHREADGGYCFFGRQEMQQLLCAQEIPERAIAVQQEYAERFRRINSCWSRPDRLWLYVCAKKPETDSAVLVNGKSVSWQQDVLRHNELAENGMVFADITDAVEWGKENRLTLKGISETAVYLCYPKPQNEQIPSRGEEFSGKVCHAPQLSEAVKILSARINEDNVLIPETKNRIEVTVNLTAEDLEGVYASVPISIGDTGFDLKRDMALEYQNGCWQKTFKSGKRIHLIIDDQKISIWAVTKENTESRTFQLPIEWILAENSSEE